MGSRDCPEKLPPVLDMLTSAFCTEAAEEIDIHVYISARLPTYLPTYLPTCLPYLTLPYLTFPCLALPCLALPYPTLPYPTLPYRTLPYLTLPYLTLPYLTLPYLPSSGSSPTSCSLTRLLLKAPSKDLGFLFQGLAWVIT